MRSFALTLLMICFSTGPLRAEGKLAEMRKAMRVDTHAPEENDDCASPDILFEDDSLSSGIDLSGLFGVLLFGPYYSELSTDAAGQQPLPSWWEFSPYPYWDASDGHLHLNIYEMEAAQRELVASLKPWMVRFSLENGNDFSGLNRFNGSLLVDFRPGIGAFTYWDYLHEDLGEGSSDQAVLGSTNIFYRLGWENFVQRWGVGMWSFADSSQADFGVNFLLAWDYFPVRPVVISTLLEGGTLGEAGVFHGRLSLGYLYRRVETYVGYDYLTIGNDLYDVSVHGPMIGLRCWF